MIEKGQVFVRAIKADGQWGNVDVLDLDEQSFRRFVTTSLNGAGPIVTFVKDDTVETPLKEKTNGTKK